MNRKTKFQTLLAYHWHTCSQLMALAAQLDVADYNKRRRYGQGSIHNILFHLARTANSWRNGFTYGKLGSDYEVDDYPTLESLQNIFRQEQSAWTELLNKWREDEIEGEASFRTQDGDKVYIRRWRILLHLVLHGMQHHAELARLLTRKGLSPGDIDFIYYI